MMRLRLAAPFAAATIALFAASGALAAKEPAEPTAASANAGLQALRDYNLITLKDLSSSQQVQGRVFVGGNLGGGSSEVYSKPGAFAGSGKAGLTVVGDVTGAKNLANGSGAQVGGSVKGGLNLNSSNQKIDIAGSATNINGSSGSAITVGGNVGNLNTNGGTLVLGGVKTGNINGKFSYAKDPLPTLSTDLQAQQATYVVALKDLSGYLAGLDATNGFKTTSNSIVFDTGGAKGDLAVFDLDLTNTSVLQNREIKFAFPTAFDTVVINVAGTDINFGANFNGPDGLGSKVIWNFYEATTLNFTNSFYGSVLAPNAAMSNSNFIQGSVAASALDQRGAIQMSNYTGKLAFADLQNAVPEPATWAMMILGFGGIDAVLRRRRKQLVPA